MKHTHLNLCSPFFKNKNYVVFKNGTYVKEQLSINTCFVGSYHEEQLCFAVLNVEKITIFAAGEAFGIFRYSNFVRNGPIKGLFYVLDKNFT